MQYQSLRTFSTGFSPDKRVFNKPITKPISNKSLKVVQELSFNNVGAEMDYEKLFALAKPILEKNDLGAAHTSRVLAIARKNFAIPTELEELTVAAIILHDIGGASIKDQYENGPRIAASILKQIGYDEAFTETVSAIVGTHHDRPDNPSAPFRILYDSDKLVLFSPEEFPGYDSRPGFDWNKIVDLLYSEKAKALARKMLRQRRKEKIP
jgi:predicted metal-dependent HD superfamily phosphohydrolase